MSRAGQVYSGKLSQPSGASSAHPASKTSTGTGDIQTFPVPAEAVAVYISVETTDARVTFDGQNPGVSTGPGVVIKAGQQPYFYAGIDPGGSIKFNANSAAASLMSLHFVT